MAKTQDFTAIFKDMMGAFPIDTAAMTDAYKNSSAMSEKMSAVAIDAAAKSTEVSSKWTKATLAKMTDLSKVKEDPADVTKAMTDFASETAEMAAEHMAAFAEIAKKVQLDTVELMLAAGKDMADETTAAVKKATDDATAAAKKMTSEATAAAKKATAKA